MFYNYTSTCCARVDVLVLTNYRVNDAEQADVKSELPLGEVPLGNHRDDEQLCHSQHALRRGDEHLVGVLLEQHGLQHHPQGPGHVGQKHQERPNDPHCCPLACSSFGGMVVVGTEGSVMVDRAQRWPGVEGIGKGTSNAQCYTGQLGHARGAP